MAKIQAEVTCNMYPESGMVFCKYGRCLRNATFMIYVVIAKVDYSIPLCKEHAEEFMAEAGE